MKTLSLTGELQHAGVEVFGQGSRKESLILKVQVRQPPADSLHTALRLALCSSFSHAFFKVLGPVECPQAARPSTHVPHLSSLAFAALVADASVVCGSRKQACVLCVALWRLGLACYLTQPAFAGALLRCCRLVPMDNSLVYHDTMFCKSTSFDQVKGWTHKQHCARGVLGWPCMTPAHVAPVSCHRGS